MRGLCGSLVWFFFYPLIPAFSPWEKGYGGELSRSSEEGLLFGLPPRSRFLVALQDAPAYHGLCDRNRRRRSFIVTTMLKDAVEMLREYESNNPDEKRALAMEVAG